MSATPTADIDDLQDRWPVFTRILTDYYVATPGATKGRRGDDATLLTRFARHGGEDDPEFTGLYEELKEMTRNTASAAALINMMFGFTTPDGQPDPTHPSYVTRSTARNLIGSLLTSLYTDPTQDTQDTDTNPVMGYTDTRVAAFDAYRSYTLFHLPASTPGTFPSWAGHLAGTPLAGAPVNAVAAAAAGALIAAIGFGIQRGLIALGVTSRAILLPASLPFLIIGMYLVLRAVITMLIVRSTVIKPPKDEDGDGVADDDEEEETTGEARSALLRALRNRD